MINLKSIVVAKNHVSCDLLNESTILNVDTGMYYGLNEIGSEIWRALKDERELSEVLTLLLEKYEVDSETCRIDLIDVVEQLHELKLVDIVI